MPESASQTVDSSGVGQWLLRSREAKGVSIEEAADVTRIGKSYIDALEQEDFAKLPAPAYCKGFLRIYAIYLELSPDEAVSRYDVMVSDSAGTVRREVVETPALEPDQQKKSNSRWLLPLVLLSVVVLMSIFIDTGNSPPIRRAPPQPEVIRSAQPAPVQPARSSAQNATLPAPPPAGQVERSDVPTQTVSGVDVQQEGLILKLKVNQDSWLNVDIDGRFSKQYDLKAGDLIEWKADSFITLDIGNAGGVEGELSGKALPSFGLAGKKAHAIIRAEGAVVQ